MKKLVLLFGIGLAVLIGCKTNTSLNNDKTLVIASNQKVIAM